MSFASLQLATAPFRAEPISARLYRASAFVARHQVAFMLPCAFAIGFMIACTL